MDPYSTVMAAGQRFIKRSKVDTVTLRLRNAAGSEIDEKAYAEKVAELHTMLGPYDNLSLVAWNEDMRQDGDIYNALTRTVLALPEILISGYGDRQVVHKNHFMMQALRIPTQREPTLGNLLEIAYYHGLLSGGLRKTDFPENVVSTYHTFRVSELATIVSRDNYAAALAKLPIEVQKALSYL